MESSLMCAAILLMAANAVAYRIDSNDMLASEMTDAEDGSLIGSYTEGSRQRSAGIPTEEIQRYLISAEYEALRRTLRSALRILESGETYLLDAARNTPNDPEMPFYLDYIYSILSGGVSRQQRRSRRKRNNFDSISHRSGLNGGLGEGHSAGTPGTANNRPRPFSFTEIFPYLLEEYRRTSREVAPDTAQA